MFMSVCLDCNRIGSQLKSADWRRRLNSLLWSRMWWRLKRRTSRSRIRYVVLVIYIWTLIDQWNDDHALPKDGRELNSHQEAWASLHASNTLSLADDESQPRLCLATSSSAKRKLTLRGSHSYWAVVQLPNLGRALHSYQWSCIPSKPYGCSAIVNV